jgi:serine/threonine-protein kinase
MSQLQPGAWFANRFYIERFIARGAHGEVYEIKHQGRPEALKIMQAQFIDNAAMQRRFAQEGELLQIFKHVNVVEVFERGLSEGVAWLRMELLRGLPLREVVRRRGALSIGMVCWYVRSAGHAAHACHVCGVIHRDIKPENLFISMQPNAAEGTVDEVVKLLDFGVIKVSGGPDTKNGQSHGTPLYMAPEQIRGKKVWAAADVYALGVTAYELFVRYPYKINVRDYDIYALFHAHFEEVPPPLVSFGVPQEISDIIAKAMAKRPEDRWQSALEYVERLWRAYRRAVERGECEDTRPGEPLASELARSTGGLWFGTGPMGATGSGSDSDGTSSAGKDAGSQEPVMAGSDGGRLHAFPSHSGEFLMHPGSKPQPPQLQEPEAARALAQTQQAGGMRSDEPMPDRGPIQRAVTVRLPDHLRDPSCIRAVGGTSAGAAASPVAARSGFVPVKTTQPMAIVAVRTRAPEPSRPLPSVGPRSQAWAEILNPTEAGVRPVPELEAAARNRLDESLEPMRRRFDRGRGLPGLPVLPARRESLSGVVRATGLRRTRYERAVIAGAYLSAMVALLALTFMVVQARAVVASSSDASSSALPAEPSPRPAVLATSTAAAGASAPASVSSAGGGAAPGLNSTSSTATSARKPSRRPPAAAPRPRKPTSEVIDPWEK